MLVVNFLTGCDFWDDVSYELVVSVSWLVLVVNSRLLIVVSVILNKCRHCKMYTVNRLLSLL